MFQGVFQIAMKFIKETPQKVTKYECYIAKQTLTRQLNHHHRIGAHRYLYFLHIIFFVFPFFTHLNAEHMPQSLTQF